MNAETISRSINLEPRDYRIVAGCARRADLGSGGFSLALGMIIREWSRLARPEPHFKFLHSLTRLPKTRQARSRDNDRHR